MQAAIDGLTGKPKAKKGKGPSIYKRPDNLARSGVRALLGAILTFIVYMAIGAIVKHFQTPCEQVGGDDEDVNLRPECRKVKRRNTLLSALGAFARFMVLVIGAISVFNILGVRAFTLVTFAGIVSLILGLAAQNALRDLFSGALILFENQVSEQDLVTLWVQNETNPVQGYVDDLSLRRIQIRTFDNSIVYVPNGSIVSITNLSQTNPILRLQVTLPSTTKYDMAVAAINKAIDDLCANSPEFMSTIAPDKAVEANSDDGKSKKKRVKDPTRCPIKSKKGAGAPHVSQLPTARPHVIGIMDGDAHTYQIGVRMMAKVGKQWSAGRMLRAEIMRELQRIKVAAVITRVKLLDGPTERHG